MRLLTCSLLLAAANASMIVLCADQIFRVENKTQIPVKVHVKYKDQKEITKDLLPAKAETIAVKHAAKGWVRVLEYITLATPGGTTKIVINFRSSNFSLMLSGPEKNAPKPIYKWELSAALSGFGDWAYVEPYKSGTFE